LSGSPLVKKFLRINVTSVEVADPSRPLEDADSEAARKWIEAENKLTFDRSSKKNLQLKIPV
jgi:hypothetical protein